MNLCFLNDVKPDTVQFLHPMASSNGEECMDISVFVHFRPNGRESAYSNDQKIPQQNIFA